MNETLSTDGDLGLSNARKWIVTWSRPWRALPILHLWCENRRVYDTAKMQYLKDLICVCTSWTPHFIVVEKVAIYLYMQWLGSCHVSSFDMAVREWYILSEGLFLAVVIRTTVPNLSHRSHRLQRHQMDRIWQKIYGIWTAACKLDYFKDCIAISKIYLSSLLS